MALTGSWLCLQILRCCNGAPGRWPQRNPGAGPQARLAIDDHLLARLETGDDQRRIPVDRIDPDGTNLGGAVGSDDPREGAVLVALHGGGGDDGRVLPGR